MFRMTVEDVFFIRGRGTVATGKVESGTLRAGDDVRINDLSVRVDGIEAFRKILDEAQAGDNVGLLFTGLDRSRINRGDVISA
jgi:elongation factor Tu